MLFVSRIFFDYNENWLPKKLFKLKTTTTTLDHHLELILLIQTLPYSNRVITEGIC